MMISMKISAMNVHYKLYSLNYFFSNISKLGIRDCELWTSPHHLSIEDDRYMNLEGIRELMDEFDVNVIAICPEQTNPKPYNLAEIDVYKQERVFNYFSNVIEVAAKLSSKIVVITSGWAFFDEDRDEAIKRSILMIKLLCKKAEELGVCLAIEALQPDESSLVNTISDLKYILTAVDEVNLKICLDFGAMAKQGETIEQYFETFGSDIVHVHFVDGNPTGHLAWGDGTRSMTQDLMSLRNYSYDGYLSLENATSRYYMKPVEADKQSISMFNERRGDI